MWQSIVNSLENSPNARIILALAVLAVLYIIVPPTLEHRRRTRRHAALLRSGTATTARVVSLRDSRDSGDSRYLIVKMQLQVMAAAGLSSFETEIEADISPLHLGAYAAGQEIAVRVDPQTREVGIDKAAMGQFVFKQTRCPHN
jgi:hypothetical protein